MTKSRSETHISSTLPGTLPQPFLPRTGPFVWGGMFLAMAAAFTLELSLGSVWIPLKAVVSILLGQADTTEDWRQIVLLCQFRVPVS